MIFEFARCLQDDLSYDIRAKRHYKRYHHDHIQELVMTHIRECDNNSGWFLLPGE